MTILCVYNFKNYTVGTEREKSFYIYFLSWLYLFMSHLIYLKTNTNKFI